MPTLDMENFLTLLLVGKTGYGKSSTGNSILGKEEFKTNIGFASQTKECKRAVARTHGHNVIVVDSPGLADTDLSSQKDIEQLKNEIETILAEQPEGFDAILIVVQFGTRLTKEDFAVCKTLDAFFGPNFSKQFGIVVVTNADQYNAKKNDDKPLEEFLRREQGLFADLLEKCENRLICFDNITNNKEIHHNQVTRLLKMVSERKEASDGYNSTAFEAARETREKAHLEAKKPFIRQVTTDKLSLVTQDIMAIPPDCKNIQQFDQNLRNVQQVHKDLIEQDKGFGVLADIISDVGMVENTLKMIIRDIEEKKDHQRRLEDLARDTYALETKLKYEKKRRLTILKCAVKVSFGVLAGCAIAILCPPKGAVGPVAYVGACASGAVSINMGTDYVFDKLSKD